MAPRFNPNGHFGTIYPPHNGAFYVQDGHYYDHDHTFVFAEESEVASAQERKPTLKNNSRFGASKLPPVQTEAEREVERLRKEMADLKAMLTASKDAAAETPVEREQAAEPVEQAGFPDLKAWAREEAVYPFYQITKYVKATYPHVVLTNTKTVLEGLKNAGVITAEDIALRG